MGDLPRKIILLILLAALADVAHAGPVEGPVASPVGRTAALSECMPSSAILWERGGNGWRPAEGKPGGTGDGDGRRVEGRSDAVDRRHDAWNLALNRAVVRCGLRVVGKDTGSMTRAFTSWGPAVQEPDGPGEGGMAPFESCAPTSASSLSRCAPASAARPSGLRSVAASSGVGVAEVTRCVATASVSRCEPASASRPSGPRLVALSLIHI